MDSLSPVDPSSYKWPEDVQSLLKEAITSLNALEQVIDDLATLCRSHYSSASAVQLERSGHDVAHALEHMEKTERTLQRIFNERGQIQ